LEQAKGNALGAGLPRGQQELRAADRERERADCSSAHEIASTDHFLPPSRLLVSGKWTGLYPNPEPFRVPVRVRSAFAFELLHVCEVAHHTATGFGMGSSRRTSGAR